MKVLITGASSGIGEACAEILAEHGHSLILVARRRDKLQQLKEKLEKQTTVLTDVVDVQSAGSVEDFFSRHKTYLQDLDVLINNAGLAKGLEPFQSAALADLETMIQTNLNGLLYFSRFALPLFIKRNTGHLINIGSVAGRWSYPKGHVYCATKAAVHSFSQALRYDLLGTSIRVTEISPGMVETEFSEVRLQDAQKAKAVYQGMTPLRPQDIAETVHFAMDRPAHVNIQELVVYPTDQASPHGVHRK